LGGAFGVPGDELVLIVIEEKIEGIGGVHIDHDEIGVVHGKLPKRMSLWRKAM